ncbi:MULTISPECIES: hypothetical protein [Okeania]|uniref:Uncharacterized protein n=1 Tax=Okeania hirsuta TaxID=1458930 RepID=A0A3N6P179_9CYAN|nr:MULTISPECIES: hypothetical protein [Okeania]NET13633.1 hypothetical protein [Okeania sp. SIO1H6]NES75509.1 hypothetical protein [Okeania sp. SIO1H4]NET17936.1 hypothetical protein [Okeania sp. SIO1H5]NET77380.1 hypothetical protein [Okeania sp. SIO1F9]NET92796.1 hypothetical protein [Okeania sp. SIO1H2]
MATKNVDLTLKWLLQSESREKFIPSLGREPWITVYFDKVTENENLGIFSALIPNADVETSLSKISWDFHLEDGHLCFNKNLNYLRFGNLDDVEPFIIHRDFHGIRDSYNEMIEEFRHFHRLYHDFEKNQLIKFDDRGDETVVAKLEMDKVEVRLKEVRQFLAVKEMYLAIYFDFKRYSELILDEFPQELEHKNKQDLTYYRLCASSAENFHIANYKSFSYLCGKKLIPPFPLNRCGMWPFNDKDKENYIDFIIGVDENGDSVKYSCNPDELANYFGANPDAPNYLTPVFFRREVLTKYYAHPEQYSVEDGFLRCQGLWGLKLDNNHPEYITVFLGDLASLPSDEQIYWRSYNILPEGKISKVNFDRSFQLTPAPPEQIDLMFKDRFVRFSKNWKESMGWSLFRELAESDQYLFETLRIPLTNSQAEFDSQVLALTKILIDSLNEREIVKATPVGNTEIKGISKFQQFLKAHQYPNYEQQIKFLRNLQELRSASVTHRKGDNYKKIAKAFGLKDSNRSHVLKNILVEVRDFLVSLERHFCE